ncbi:hypothetical protein RUND412_010134 [Rhizina undulata]
MNSNRNIDIHNQLLTSTTEVAIAGSQILTAHNTHLELSISGDLSIHGRYDPAARLMRFNYKLVGQKISVQVVTRKVEFNARFFFEDDEGGGGRGLKVGVEGDVKRWVEGYFKDNENQSLEQTIHKLIQDEKIPAQLGTVMIRSCGKAIDTSVGNFLEKKISPKHPLLDPEGVYTVYCHGIPLASSWAGDCSGETLKVYLDE